MGEINQRSESRAEEQLFQSSDGVQSSARSDRGEELREWSCRCQ